MGKSVVAQIVELETMPIEKLKNKWETLFNTKPPASHTRKQLVGRIAYRIQELVYGGLSEETRRKLEEIGSVPQQQTSPSKSGKSIPGTRYVREWQGARYEVEVMERGFAYRGKHYKSLTAIATEITGTKWSGPDFFGLRRQSGMRHSL